MFAPRFHLIALFIFSCGASHVQAQGWAEKMLKEGVTHDFGTIPRGARNATPLSHHQYLRRTHGNYCRSKRLWLRNGVGSQAGS